MPPGASDRTDSRHAAGLLLRVQRPDGHADEFYLAGGLTIGRSPANDVALPDDEAVDRTHARVGIAADGSAWLRCISPGNTILVDGTPVNELKLVSGVRFRIGRAEFECVAGGREADLGDHREEATCPHCGATGVPADGGAVRRCPGCGGEILAVWLDLRATDLLLVPVRYGAYRADRYVARGGMGLVLKGASDGDDTPVAIKVILPGTIDERRDAARFEKEVSALERVRHPNVVRLLDHGTAGRFRYLVLEWIDGPDLRRVIDDTRAAERPTDFSTALGWFRQVCQGLAAIHAVGLVHRDIKPSNILIGQDGVARIADLGIARRIDPERTSGTTTGQVPGSFHYMAPEQFDAPETVDGRADLYALGVTFYELLTVARPVGAWQRASMVNPSVPKVFDDVLGRLLAPRPEQRYSDIFEFLATISTLRPTPTPASSSRTPTADPGQRNSGQGRTPVEREEPPPTLLSIMGRRITAFRSRHSAAKRAYLAARTGAIWGGTLLGAAGALVGVPVACLLAAFSHELRFLLLVFTFVWVPAILGAVSGGLVGAVWGAIVAASGRDPGVIRVAGGGPEGGTSEVLASAPKDAAEERLTGSLVAPTKRVDKKVLRFALLVAVVYTLRFPLDFALDYFYPERVQERQANRAYSSIAEAMTQLDRDQVDQAIHLCDQALADGPADGSIPAHAHSIRALAYAKKGNTFLSLLDSSRAKQLDPTSAQTHYFRGRIFILVGDSDQAIPEFSKSLELGPPKHAFIDEKELGNLNRVVREGAHLGRGEAYFLKRQYEQAIADLNEGIRLSPNDAEPYYYRGQCYRQQGRLGEAVADFETALRLNPSGRDAHRCKEALDATRAGR
jgi:serine/threonine protein kinase/tetratricopeptide (TPR) repeat protein